MTRPDLPADSFRAHLRADLRTAMRDRDALRTSTLRTLIAAIDNAESVPLPPAPEGGLRAVPVSAHVVVSGDGPSEVERRALSEAEVTAVLEREIEATAADAELMRRAGQTEAADVCAARARILQSYLASRPV